MLRDRVFDLSFLFPFPSPSLSLVHSPLLWLLSKYGDIITMISAREGFNGADYLALPSFSHWDIRLSLLEWVPWKNIMEERNEAATRGHDSISLPNPVYSPIYSILSLNGSKKNRIE